MAKKSKKKIIEPKLIFITFIICLVIFIFLILSKFFIKNNQVVINNQEIKNQTECKPTRIFSEGTEIDINSEEISRLYSVVKINKTSALLTSNYEFPTSDNYFNKKITNKYIIELGIFSMDKTDDYYSGDCDGQSCEYYHKTNNLDKKIKDIFGKEIKYELEEFRFLKLSKNKQVYSGGFETNPMLIHTYTKLVNAYKTVNKIILFEKGLFFKFNQSGNYDNFTAYDFINGNILEDYVKRVTYPVKQSDVFEEVYQKHICNLSTYKYIFTQNDNGGYYLTGFEKIN